ncbi:MAG: cysteine--tRNA ligase [Leptospirales bacterium]|nr:cysteine--tRNA ligase [Leptospirales bacterium]
MPIRIYNTLTRRLDELAPGGIPKDDVSEYPPVTIYSCGPTVYSFAHIGNFRTFVFNDLLRRYLKFRGYSVNHAMNITDVDDKTIAGAANEGIDLKDYTSRYTDIFMEDMKTLNIEPVEHIPKATESIDGMIDIIKRLDEKDIIYEKGGSVYFGISRWDKYGKLSLLDSREIKTGLRYDTDEYDKDDVRDFALWKEAKEGGISWETPYGKGRPGWHIECSAMVRKIFGTTIDIHTGGVDLIFPHHENEIAQSEAAYGEKFVRYWLHVEHLLVDGAKMSKSKGNFYTLRDILEKGYSPRSIRYLLVSAHYRKQFNFTLEGIKQADQALGRIDNFMLRLKDVRNEGGAGEAAVKIDAFFNDFEQAADDDLNITRGIGIFFEFMHDINSMIDENRLSAKEAAAVIEALKRIDQVFGFIFFGDAVSNDDAGRIESLIAERIAAKKAKDFALSDKIRDDLLAEGIVLEDTKDGTRWKRKT